MIPQSLKGLPGFTGRAMRGCRLGAAPDIKEGKNRIKNRLFQIWAIFKDYEWI
jgi:hypothetical protein